MKIWATGRSVFNCLSAYKKSQNWWLKMDNKIIDIQDMIYFLFFRNEICQFQGHWERFRVILQRRHKKYHLTLKTKINKYLTICTNEIIFMIKLNFFTSPSRNSNFPPFPKPPDTLIIIRIWLIDAILRGVNFWKKEAIFTSNKYKQ